MKKQEIEQYWHSYLAATHNASSNHEAYEVQQFGDHAALADELGNLILSGVKTATMRRVSTTDLWNPGGRSIGTISHGFYPKLVSCSRCRCGVVGQHQDLVCPGREFKSRHLLVLV